MRSYRPLSAVVFAIAVSALVGGLFGKSALAVDDRTPTLGRRRSFFDELFGNIGVLNSGALGQTQPGQ